MGLYISGTYKQPPWSPLGRKKERGGERKLQKQEVDKLREVYGSMYIYILIGYFIRYLVFGAWLN